MAKTYSIRFYGRAPGGNAYIQHPPGRPQNLYVFPYGYRESKEGWTTLKNFPNGVGNDAQVKKLMAQSVNANKLNTFIGSVTVRTENQYGAKQRPSPVGVSVPGGVTRLVDSFENNTPSETGSGKMVAVGLAVVAGLFVAFKQLT